MLQRPNHKKIYLATDDELRNEIAQREQIREASVRNVPGVVKEINILFSDGHITSARKVTSNNKKECYLFITDVDAKPQE